LDLFIVWIPRALPWAAIGVRRWRVFGERAFGGRVFGGRAFGERAFGERVQ